MMAWFMYWVLKFIGFSLFFCSGVGVIVHLVTLTNARSWWSGSDFILASGHFCNEADFPTIQELLVWPPSPKSWVIKVESSVLLVIMLQNWISSMALSGMLRSLLFWIFCRPANFFVTVHLRFFVINGALWPLHHHNLLVWTTSLLGDWVFWIFYRFANFYLLTYWGCYHQWSCLTTIFKVLLFGPSLCWCLCASSDF